MLSFLFSNNQSFYLWTKFLPFSLKKSSFFLAFLILKTFYFPYHFLFLIFLFIWLLYFRASQSLFWPGRNLLFYFWLPCSHVNTSVKKRPREDVVLGFRLAARLFAQSCSRPRSPGQAEASGQVSSKDGLNPARDGQPGPDTQAHLTGEDIRTWSKITCF